MVNSYLGTRSPKGNVGVRGVVDAGELSAFTRGVLSGFAGNSVTASWTLNVGGISGTQDVAVAKNPGGESDLLVGTAGQSIAFVIGGAPGTPGQSRTDALVAHKDPFITSVDNDGLDAVDYEVVPGTAATTGTQVPPNDATITAACPTGAFITVIGYVTVAQGASSITTANFTRNFAASLKSPLVIANAAERSALTPFEGMEIYRADLDCKEFYNGTTWQKLAINCSYDIVTAQVTTASTSYVGLSSSTPSLSVVVPPSGVIKVEQSLLIANTVAGNLSYAGFDLSGANTLSAADTNPGTILMVADNNGFQTFSSTTVLEGLTPGATTLTAKYRVSNGTGTFQNRTLIATPLP
jgi:hypothetical protein